jgi:hypothetical protein
MIWKQIGDVTRDVKEPFAVAFCFREWEPASNGSDFVGIVAFNHPRDWSPNDDQNAEVDECCRDVAQQICDGEIQRGEGQVLWDEQLAPATKKISREISQNEETLTAWCKGKYFVPILIRYATHDIHVTMQ